MNWVLGLDTSCYTTSAAAVSMEGDLIVSCRRLLVVPKGSRGLRQNEMIFQHVGVLPGMIESVIEKTGTGGMAAVCVSSRPRAVEGSYMPAFTAGQGFGRAIAAVRGIPCYATSHQQGHVAAARMGSELSPGGYLALHLSGGTTEVLACEGDPPRIALLGGTKDIALGQLVDRVGVRLGLPFPAGPHLEGLAGDRHPDWRLPVTVDGCSLNVSGTETAALRAIDAGLLPQCEIAGAVYDYLACVVARLLIGARRAAGSGQALLAGGVASSPRFRRDLERELSGVPDAPALYWARRELAGDNAAGTAAIGAAFCREAGIG